MPIVDEGVAPYRTLVTDRGFQIQGDPINVVFHDLNEIMEECRRRVADGHTLYRVDEVSSRRIGAIDLNDHELLLIGLNHAKIGLDQQTFFTPERALELLRTHEGRIELLGVSRDPFFDSGGSDEGFAEIEELRALWTSAPEPEEPQDLSWRFGNRPTRDPEEVLERVRE